MGPHRPVPTILRRLRCSDGPLLTIASFEWEDGELRGWAPCEDQSAAHAAGHRGGHDPAQPTKVEVGHTDNMQLYVCPTSPEHPHTDLIQ